MTKQEKEHKIKIATLIIIVLIEKVRKLSKEPNIDNIILMINTATEIMYYAKEIVILNRKCLFPLGGTIRGDHEIIIPPKRIL